MTQHNTENEDNNKHIKVSVRYIGSTEPYNHNYLPENTILMVKENAMSKFTINSPPDKYYLQYQDTILNDNLTLIQAGFQSNHERITLELNVRDDQDTDG